MKPQLGVGQALAELVNRLTPEEKQEFVRWLSWDELETLRQAANASDMSVEHPETAIRRVGEPEVYVGTTVDGLALELPAECTVEFLKHLPALLSASSIAIYLRSNGHSEEHHLIPETFNEFLETHQEVLVNASAMIELDNATLVSGGGGCLLLSVEGISGELQRRLATKALQICGFSYEFTGNDFTAIVWNGELEVSDR